MNKVVLVGRLSRDPDLKFTPGDGRAYSKFTVAVNRPIKKGETDFISCIAWGKTAELISTYFTKGRQIAISGSIQTGSYEAKDGTKKYTTDVVVDSFDFLDSKGGGTQQGVQEPQGFDGMEQMPIDGDIPF